ncbi:MAG: ABC transporter ATP-binding protein [Clostridia bacterium]|nr:ABC transporter ATP-binding protein [Clostridia bacterium]
MNNHVRSCVKKQKLRLWCGVSLGVVQSISSIAFSAQMGRLLDSALIDQSAISKAILFSLILFLVSMLAEFAAQAARLAFSNASSYTCTTELLSHLAHMPGYVDRNPSDQINLLYHDQDMLYSDCFSAICETVQYFSATLFALLLLTAVHPYLAIWGILSALASLWMGKVFHPSLDRSRNDMSQANERYYHELSQTINGYDIIKRSGAVDAFCNRLSYARNQTYHAFNANRLTLWISFHSSQLILSLSMLGVVCFVGLLISKGSSTPGAMLLSLNLISYCIGCTQTFVQKLATLRSAQVIIDRTNEALSHPNEKPTEHLATAAPEVTAEQISFAYTDTKPIIKNLSFSLAAGGCYAIVGSSGSGKTTLLHILQKNLIPQTGRLLYDGIDIRCISQDELYQHMAVLCQKPFLLNDTLRENIELFGPALTDEEYLRLLTAVCLRDFSTSVADRRVGDLGDTLSGGERQRVGLARALCKKPQILLLDEPAAGLDRKTAKEIEEFIFSLNKITRVVVTHNPSEEYLSRFDSIIRLD